MSRHLTGETDENLRRYVSLAEPDNTKGTMAEIRNCLPTNIRQICSVTTNT